MGAYRWMGILFALGGTIAFAFRPVLVKLAYESAPVSATTLLFLRMALSLPFFAAVAWWLRREPALARRDWAGIAALGFLGYYLASLLDFLGLQYVPAGLGRLIMFLYPTLVVILSALFLVGVGLAIAWRVRASFSIIAKRTWPSPNSPKPTPADTDTFACDRIRFVNSSEPAAR